MKHPKAPLMAGKLGGLRFGKLGLLHQSNLRQKMVQQSDTRMDGEAI